MYGFLEENSCAVLSSKWLHKHSPRVQIYASGVVRCYVAQQFMESAVRLMMKPVLLKWTKKIRKRLKLSLLYTRVKIVLANLHLASIQQLLVIMSFVIQIEFTHFKTTNNGWRKKTQVEEEMTEDEKEGCY